MAVHLLTDSDFDLLKELVQWWRKYKQQGINRNPSLTGDLQDILTPEVHIARTPTDGIPALTQSSSLGTGTPPTTRQDPDRPGYAFCYIYNILEDDFGIDRLYPIGQAPLKVYNLLSVAIPGNAWFSPIRTKQGRWIVPAQGFEFAQCEDEVAPTPGTGSAGTGTGEGIGECFEGLCGDTGVVSGLIATITNKMGCFATIPDVIQFDCDNFTATTHRYVCGELLGTCGCSAVQISDLRPTFAEATLALVCSAFTPNELYIGPESGWTCRPFSAVYLVDDGAGNSCTITVIE